MPVQGIKDEGTPLLSTVVQMPSQGTSDSSRSYTSCLVKKLTANSDEKTRYVSNIRYLEKPYWRQELRLKNAELAKLLHQAEIHDGPDYPNTVTDVDKLIRKLNLWSHGNLKGQLGLTRLGGPWNIELQIMLEHKSDLVMFKLVWL